MSWLSVIKNNIVNAISHAVPQGEQQAAHDKTMNVANAIHDLLTTLENDAQVMIDTFVSTKYGPTAAVLEHDFLSAVIAYATAKKAATSLPAPVPIAVPAAQPAQPSE